MDVQEIVALHECPVCSEFPRPYKAVALCVEMHMTCGVCHHQAIGAKRKCCSKCRQPFRKYSDIPGFHYPLRWAQERFSYPCLNKLYGCKEQFSFLTVELHDKLCDYMPYICGKRNCGFNCIYSTLPTHNHLHTKIIFHNPTDLSWNFFLPLNKFYSRFHVRVRLSQTTPYIILLRGSEQNNVDWLFKPMISFVATLPGNGILIKIIWHCKEVFSLIDITDFYFLITVYVKTAGGYLKRTFVSQAAYISKRDTSYNRLDETFFTIVQQAFTVSKCMECLSSRPHLHFKIELVDLVPGATAAATNTVNAAAAIIANNQRIIEL